MSTDLRAALDTPAVRSAIDFIEESVAPRRCDNEAVSDCVRCNSVALARWVVAAQQEQPPRTNEDLLGHLLAAGNELAVVAEQTLEGTVVTDRIPSVMEWWKEKARAAHDRLLAATPAPPALDVERLEEARQWRVLIDDYSTGTLFITDDPKDSQRPIAEGLSEKQAEAIVKAHNSALAAMTKEQK